MNQSLAAVVVSIALALAACTADSYESLMQDVNELLRKDISISTEDKDKVTQLRSEGERLHKDGKTQESLEALKQARQILQRAKDADLLRKSEG